MDSSVGVVETSDNLWDQIVFNDDVDDDWFISVCEAELEYCRFESIMGQYQEDIYIQRTFADPAYETMDESEWVY